MPRFEYRNLAPTPDAEKGYVAWIERLDEEFMNRDPEHRSSVVRDTLCELYLGQAYAARPAAASLPTQALFHSFYPRNATLEPEYYGDADPVRYAHRQSQRPTADEHT